MPGRSAISSKKGPVKIDHKADPTAKIKSVPAFRHPMSEAVVEVQAAVTQAPTSVQPIEPEDAYLTGVSRSLQRRLLGLNVSQAKPVPGASVAGIHSTGSFTEGQGAKPGESSKSAQSGKKK